MCSSSLNRRYAAFIGTRSRNVHTDGCGSKPCSPWLGCSSTLFGGFRRRQVPAEVASLVSKNIHLIVYASVNLYWKVWKKPEHVPNCWLDSHCSCPLHVATLVFHVWFGICRPITQTVEPFQILHQSPQLVSPNLWNLLGEVTEHWKLTFGSIPTTPFLFRFVILVWSLLNPSMAPEYCLKQDPLLDPLTPGYMKMVPDIWIR